MYVSVVLGNNAASTVYRGAQKNQVDLDVTFNRESKVIYVGHKFIPKVTITRQEDSNSQRLGKNEHICNALCNSNYELVFNNHFMRREYP